MHARLASLEALIGTSCDGLLGKRARVPVIVFDWERIAARRRADFLADIFGDLDDPKAFAGIVSRDDGDVRWVSTRFVPFALGGVDAGERQTRFRGGDDYPQFARLLLADVSSAAANVHAIDVDGTAIAARTPRKLGTLAAMKLRAAPDNGTADERAASNTAATVKSATPKPAGSGGLRKLAQAFQMALFVFSMSKKRADLKKAEQALTAFERAFAGSPQASATPSKLVAKQFRALLDKVRAMPASYRAVIPRFSKLFASLG